MNRQNNYIKFSSHLDGERYFTMIDLDREHIRVQKNGITVFDDKLKRFKITVADGGWLHNRMYQEILDNAEKLMDILTKA